MTDLSWPTAEVMMRTVMAIVLLSVLASAGVAVVGQGFIRTTVPSGKVSFEYPADWRVLASKSPDSDKVMVANTSLSHGVATVAYVELTSATTSADRLNARILSSVRFPSAEPPAPVRPAESSGQTSEREREPGSSFDDGTVQFQQPAGWRRSGTELVSRDGSQHLRIHRRNVSSCELKAEVHRAHKQDIMSGETGWLSDTGAPFKPGFMRDRRTLHTSAYRRRSGEVRVLSTFCFNDTAITLDFIGSDEAVIESARVVLPTVVLAGELTLVGSWSSSGTRCQFLPNHRFDCRTTAGGDLAFPTGTWTDDGTMRPTNASQACKAVVNKDVTATITCPGGSFKLSRE